MTAIIIGMVVLIVLLILGAYLLFRHAIKNDDEKLNILRNLVEKSFYELSKDKNSWNYVDNNFIKPVIKKLHPITNSNLVLEKC